VDVAVVDVVVVDLAVVVGCVVVDDGAGDVEVVTGSDVVTSVSGVVDVMSVEGVVSLVDTTASSPLQPSAIESAKETAIRPGRMFTRLTSCASIISGADRRRQGPRTHLAMCSSWAEPDQAGTLRVLRSVAVGDPCLGSHVGSAWSSSMLLDRPLVVTWRQTIVTTPTCTDVAAPGHGGLGPPPLATPA
jgi:hypothetical protein